MEDNEKKSSLGGNIAGKFMGSGMADMAEISEKLRNDKMGATMDFAEKGVGMAISAYTGGLGKFGLKAAESVGIPVNKIIVISIIFLVLFFFLIVLAGGYALVNKWGILWDGFWSLFS